MARLFVTPREMNFIADITKEIAKDINGQVIHYYPVSELKTKTHDVYGEAIEKVFDQPIAVEAFVNANYQADTVINQFGVDAIFKIEVFIQWRDLVDKSIELAIGDFFSFGDVFYEITEAMVLKNIFGQAEHQDGLRVVGTRARDGQFQAMLKGPSDLIWSDDDAVQKKFVQQRGAAENSEGPTGDKREMFENGHVDPPPDGPREVSEQGAKADNSNYASSFYSDSEDDS